MRSTDEETKRTIARKVVEPLSNLDRLSKKAAWFDKERFKDDVFRVFQGRPVGIKRMNITPQPSQRLRLPWRLGDLKGSMFGFGALYGDGFLQDETGTEVLGADVLVGGEGFRRTLLEDSAFVKEIGAVGDRQTSHRHCGR